MSETNTEHSFINEQIQQLQARPRILHHEDPSEELTLIIRNEVSERNTKLSSINEQIQQLHSRRLILELEEEEENYVQRSRRLYSRPPLMSERNTKLSSINEQIQQLHSRCCILQLEEEEENPMKRSSSFEFLPPLMSELRVVLLGNSWSERSSVGNFILGETKFTEEEPDHCVRERGGWKEKEIVLINTPDLLQPNISEDRLRRHVKICESLSDPGPHVFLLVLQPEDFTEELKEKLCRVLELFSDQSFDHSLILISTPREESLGFMERYIQHPPLKEMIRKCKYRFLWRKYLEHPELLTRLGQVVKENNGEHV